MSVEAFDKSVLNPKKTFKEGDTKVDFEGLDDTGKLQGGMCGMHGLHTVEDGENRCEVFNGWVS
jgi:hypothetical protein